jgi:hypothetical protein
LNLIQWLITVFLVASFLLFDAYSWGKYVLVVSAALIFLITVIKNRFKIRLCLEPFIYLMLVFTAYVAVTAIWAISSTDTLTMARTLLRIVLCFVLIYWAYAYDTDPYRLITVVVSASYVVAIYYTLVLGIDNIISASDSILTDSSANINSVTLFLAFGCICSFYLMLYHRFRLYYLLSVLSIVIIASMRTRKAIIFVAVGVITLLLFRYSDSRSFFYRMLRVIAVLAVVLFLLYYVSQLSIFDGVRERMDQLLNSVTGSGKADTSSLMRQDLIKLGVFLWSKRPFNGIGVGNTHFVAAQYLYFNSYLHNNYVELLAGGGIAAFILYYSMYAYLVYGYIKLRKSDYQWFAFGLVIILLLLVTDYGRVSYYSKTVYFELMMLFLTLRIVRANRKEASDALKSA